MRNLFIAISTVVITFLLASCQDQQKPGYYEDDGLVLPEDTNLHLDEPVFSGELPGADSRSAFSQIVQAGDLYFLAGKIGRDPQTGELAVGGIEAETRQTLENIKKVMEDNGLQMTDVVKAMVVLDDIEDFSAFNKIYMEYFPQKPARTTFAAEALALGAKIEIEVMAVKKSVKP